MIKVACKTLSIFVRLSRTGQQRLLMVGDDLLIGSVLVPISRMIRSSFSKGISTLRISSIIMGPLWNPDRFGLLPSANPCKSSGCMSFLKCFIVF
jgi:hypothetical protein